MLVKQQFKINVKKERNLTLSWELPYSEQLGRAEVARREPHSVQCSKHIWEFFETFKIRKYLAQYSKLSEGGRHIVSNARNTLQNSPESLIWFHFLSILISVFLSILISVFINFDFRFFISSRNMEEKWPISEVWGKVHTQLFLANLVKKKKKNLNFCWKFVDEETSIKMPHCQSNKVTWV